MNEQSENVNDGGVLRLTPSLGLPAAKTLWQSEPAIQFSGSTVKGKCNSCSSLLSPAKLSASVLVTPLKQSVSYAVLLALTKE